jgi:hypothetical protein
MPASSDRCRGGFTPPSWVPLAFVGAGLARPSWVFSFIFVNCQRDPGKNAISIFFEGATK